MPPLSGRFFNSDKIILCKETEGVRASAREDAVQSVDHAFKRASTISKKVNNHVSVMNHLGTVSRTLNYAENSELMTQRCVQYAFNTVYANMSRMWCLWEDCLPTWPSPLPKQPI